MQTGERGGSDACALGGSGNTNSQHGELVERSVVGEFDAAIDHVHALADVAASAPARKAASEVASQVEPMLV